MKLAGHIVCKRRGSGAAQLFDRRSGGVFALNPVGDVLITALVRGATRDELSALLTRNYDVAVRVARHDVDAFLATLGQHGLLEG